jgi:hypothetical protein
MFPPTAKNVRERYAECGHDLYPLLSSWPLPLPPRWLATVNLPADPAEDKLMTESIARNRPVGSESWVRRTAKALGLEQSLRPRGRPMGWRKARIKQRAAG